MKDLRLLLVGTILDLHYGSLFANKKSFSEKIIGLCEFGSTTYGTTHKNSDYDFVVVLDLPLESYFQYCSDDVDIHIFSKPFFLKKLYEHDIMALEVYYNPKQIVSFDWVDFELDLVKLRHKISAIVSNSWVKARKKVNLENEDSFIGIKSLFHSLRILSFGIQLAENKIIDFESCKDDWKMILGMYERNHTIEEIMEYFKPSHNANASKFRILAPKE